MQKPLPHHDRRALRRYQPVGLAMEVPASPAAAHRLERSDDGAALVFTYDTQADRTGITSLLSDLNSAGIRVKDLHTDASSLEDIFVNLVRSQA